MLKVTYQHLYRKTKLYDTRRCAERPITTFQCGLMGPVRT